MFHLEFVPDLKTGSEKAGKIMKKGARNAGFELNPTVGARSRESPEPKALPEVQKKATKKGESCFTIVYNKN